MFSSWARTTFVALGHRDYRYLFAGTVLAMLGFGMMPVIQGIVAFNLTGKNSSVGLVSLGMGVSMLVLGPIGGALSDRLPKRRLLFIGQSIICVTFAIVGILIITDTITIWMLALSTLVMGAMFAFIGPTRQAWTGDLLDSARLSNAIALQQIAMNATRIAGPFMAGGFVAFHYIGAGGAYLFMSGFFVLVVLTIFPLPNTPPAHSSGRGVFSDIASGASYIWHKPDLRLFALMFMGTVLTGFSYQTLMPGFLENELHRDSRYLGMLYGVAAVGGLALTLLLASRPIESGGRTLMFVFGALLAAGIVALSFAPTFLLALAAMVAVGMFSSGFQLLNNVNLMQLCEPEYYGRVMALTMMSFGLNSVAAYPFGLIADAIGERQTLLLAGSLAFGVVLIGLLLSARIPQAEPRSIPPLARPKAGRTGAG